MSVAGLMLAGIVGVSSATGVAAHPLGNFTSNTYAGLVVASDHISIDYVLDLAEIPTQQVRPAIGDDFEDSRSAELAAGLDLTVGDNTIEVAVDGARITFPPGLAGLDTLRLECDLVAATAPLADGDVVSFEDGNLDGVIGWREVTAVGDGMTLVGSDVPEESVSGRLASYPEGQRSLDVTTASFRVGAGGAAAPASSPAAPAERGVEDGQSRWLGSLVDDKPLTLGAGAIALLVAVVLGSLHALAPGHGKTIMAAYIVGRRGRLRHVLGMGATVAITHTIGVLGLGVILTTSESFAGARVYPVLGAVSGALVVAVGIGLLRRLVRPTGHSHDHHHHDPDHDHPHDHDHPDVSRSGLVAMGMAGGLVPSPSAVLVLLGALALGRAWFGILLVLAYGVGMAVTLLGAGLVLNRLRDWIEPRFARLTARRLPRLLPMGTALAVIGGGLLLTVRAVAAV